MSLPDDKTTRDALDEAVRAHAEDVIDDGEVITAWIVLAATRHYNGGGCVISMPSDGVMPRWEARGILASALATFDQGDES